MERIEALEDAIQKKNLVGIYSVFYTIAHGDPNFSTGKFEEMLRYVKSKDLPGLLQEFDGDEFETEEKWDEEYWAFIASTLMDNFCEERIKHLKQVGQKVYPVKTSVKNNARTASAPEIDRSYGNSRQMQRRSSSASNERRGRGRTAEPTGEERFEDSSLYKVGKVIHDIIHGGR